MCLVTCAQVPCICLITSSLALSQNPLCLPDASLSISCLSYRPPNLLLAGITFIQTQGIFSTVLESTTAESSHLKLKTRQRGHWERHKSSETSDLFLGHTSSKKATLPNPSQTVPLTRHHTIFKRMCWNQPPTVDFSTSNNFCWGTFFFLWNENGIGINILT